MKIKSKDHAPVIQSIRDSVYTTKQITFCISFGACPAKKTLYYIYFSVSRVVDPDAVVGADFFLYEMGSRFN